MRSKIVPSLLVSRRHIDLRRTASCICTCAAHSA
ncbi:putative leader peptide [Frankia nepalensis]